MPSANGRRMQFLALVSLVFFPQMPQHIANLVHLAALHDGGLGRRLTDRRKEGLSPIENIQPWNFEIEATIGQIRQQLPDDGAVLGRSLAHTQHELLAVNCDSQRADQLLVAERRAVDQHRTERVIVQTPRQQVAAGSPQ